MPRVKIETPVVVPKPKVALKNSGLEIEGQADLDQVLICALDNGRPTTQVLRKELCAPIGTQNLVDLNELKWKEQVVPGRTYTINVMGADKKGDNSSSEFATVDWSIPAIPAPGNAEPAKDDGSKPTGQADPPKPRKLPSAEVVKITEVLTRAHRDLKFFTAKPEELNRRRCSSLDNHVVKTGGVINNEYGSDESLSSLRRTWFECSTMLAELSEKLKARKERKPAPSPEPDDHTRIADRVGNLEENLDEVKEELGRKASKGDLKEVKEGLGKKIGEVSTQVADGNNTTSERLVALTKAIEELRQPATTTADASGNGGNSGGSGASGGGKASPPKSVDRSWIMLLLGILGTLLLLIGVGGWIVSSFFGGWILGSKAPMAGFMPAMVPPVIMITNTVTPPPAVQQVVTSTQPVLTPEEIQAYANKHLAMKIQANKVTENIPGLTSHPVDQTTKGGKEINNSGIIGNGNTIINNYHQAPDVHRNGDQAVTPRHTDDVTPTNTMAVRPDSDWTGPRVVRTLPNWGPTGTFGKVEFLDLYGPGTGFASE